MRIKGLSGPMDSMKRGCQNSLRRGTKREKAEPRQAFPAGLDFFMGFITTIPGPNEENRFTSPMPTPAPLARQGMSWLCRTWQHFVVKFKNLESFGGIIRGLSPYRQPRFNSSNTSQKFGKDLPTASAPWMTTPSVLSPNRAKAMAMRWSL